MTDTDTPTAEARQTTVPVEQVQAHPDNVRHDLRLTDWFLNSVRTNGVRVPLVVAALGDGAYEVIMGHRRLAAAQQTGRTEVPVYVVDPSLREAGEDYIEMLIENAREGREGLTQLEEADALFKAEEAGMTRAQVAERTGRSTTGVKQAVAVACGLGKTTRSTLAETGEDWNLADLAVLGEFDDDPKAIERLIAARDHGYLAHQAARERADREERQARAARREEFAATGVHLIESEEDLPLEAEWLSELYDQEGTRLTEEAHASCPGRAAVWDESSPAPGAVAWLCTDPKAHGHHLAGDHHEGDEDEAGADSGTAGRPAAAAPEKPTLPHRLKVEGNRAWRAANTARREWLRTLLARKTAPKGVLRFVTEQMYICPKPLASWTGDPARAALLTELRGKETNPGAAGRAEWVEASASPGRLQLLQLAPLAAAYEKRAEAVQTWRHDKPEWDTEEVRADARTYLGFLASIGYSPSPIEQAVIDDEPYDPDAQPTALDEEAEQPGDGSR